MSDKENLVWLDLEMTGLRPDIDTILEIATVVTDKELNVLAEGPNLAIHQDEQTLAGMDDWNQQQHGKSGLLARVRASQVSLAQAEQQTLAFLRLWVDERSSPLCGNSICQDRRFLYRHMPMLESFFHYRNLDVSTLKELAKRWAPQVLANLTKQEAHLALADVHESIRELHHYRRLMFAGDLRQR
jgi:oligoribonuclease